MNFCHELGIDCPPLPMSEFESLCRLKPDAMRISGIRYQLISNDVCGDEFIQNALNVLKRHNIPRRGTADDKSYGYCISRFYEPDDLASSELLRITRQPRIHNTLTPPRDEQGRLFIVASKAKKSLKLTSTWWPDWIIVSNKVRQSFEEGGLVGLKFGEVAIKGKSANLSPEPFWELLSSVTLPKMPYPERLIHSGMYEPVPFQGDYSRVVYIDDRPFHGAEVHYRRSDLAALGHFDIAATFENYMEPHPALIVSQRFYQHCLKNKIPLKVEPVRIDPD